MEYKKGMVLVFQPSIIESDTKHVERFTKGTHYIISDICDYNHEEYDPGFNKVISFENSKFGCFIRFADKNFTILENYRDMKIKNILE
jgi:hypothetical protein